jgi:hypothetical protein
LGGYISSAVYYQGANKGTSEWDPPDNSATRTLTVNYTNAYMSLPKTVYVKGEDIPISYFTAGSVIDSTKPYYPEGVKYNSPWIGIFEYDTDKNPPTKEEIERNRHYVDPDTAGVEYISTDNLEAGTYQIYLRDNSATLYHSNLIANEYWWQYDMAEPITVYIIEPDAEEGPKIDTSITYDFSNFRHQALDNSWGFSSGTVSLDDKKTVFYQGDDINITVSGLASSSDVLYRLVLTPDGDDVTWTASMTPQNGLNTINTSSIAPGQYTLYLFNAGGVESAKGSGRSYAIVDITILPVESKDKIGGSVDMHTIGENGNLSQKDENPTIISDPFKYYNVNKTFEVTQEDVDRGYVFLEYDFTGLGSDMEFTFAVDKLTMTKQP